MCTPAGKPVPFSLRVLVYENLMKKNLCVAKKFNNTIRYIDDLLTVNNSKFEKEICNIYPPELTLKRTSESERNLSYLDISISICGGKYVTEVYDKRDDFNFDIVNFPYMCSNIPAKPTYGVYIHITVNQNLFNL